MLYNPNSKIKCSKTPCRIDVDLSSLVFVGVSDNLFLTTNKNCELFSYIAVGNNDNKIRGVGHAI